MAAAEEGADRQARLATLERTLAKALTEVVIRLDLSDDGAIAPQATMEVLEPVIALLQEGDRAVLGDGLGSRLMSSRSPHLRLKRLKAPAAPKLPSSLAAAQFPEHDLEDDGTYRGLEFKGADLTACRADAADYEGCRFVTTSFSGAHLRRAGFIDVELQRCDLSNMTAMMSGMHRTQVSASRLTGMTWSECAFRDVIFDTCRADLAGFRFSTFKNTVFRDCIMAEVNFQNADLRGVRFERCDLSRAQFSQAQMDGTHFSDCELLGIGGVTSLKGAIIKSADAQGLLFALAGAMGILIAE
ncbi:MAG TPA: pentapeptide repeat-containing protein [Nonomuraea sp.]|nr:pentapeptide repeat-containing protein [Nonomuraea sp.]